MTRGAALRIATHSSLLVAGGSVVLAVVAFGLHLGGYDALAAMRALWGGSLGTTSALLSSTLVRAVPLILAGLAVALAFRAGVWNIGAEGQLLAGAAAATALALWMGGAAPWVALPLVMLAGAAAGALWAAIAAFLRRRYGVLEVISTIMLNFLAFYIVAYLVRGPLQEPLGIYPQTSTIPQPARLPQLIAEERLHWGFVLALGIAPALWWTLRMTAAGFRVRAVGLNADAARAAGGVNVARVTARAFAVSGALAGLAGAVEVSGVTLALYENLSPGYGYTAIAVALLARLHPLAVVATGVLFGALEAGALAMQREAAVPAVVVTTVEAALILIALLADRWLRRVAIEREIAVATPEAA